MKGNKVKDTEFPALDTHGINTFIDGREPNVRQFYTKVTNIESTIKLPERDPNSIEIDSLCVSLSDIKLIYDVIK